MSEISQVFEMFVLSTWTFDKHLVNKNLKVRSKQRNLKKKTLQNSVTLMVSFVSDLNNKVFRAEGIGMYNISLLIHLYNSLLLLAIY